MNLNHVGTASPKRVSFSPIVFFPSVRTLYSQERANAHPPAGLAPFKNTLLISVVYISYAKYFTNNARSNTLIAAATGISKLYKVNHVSCNVCQ